MTKPDPTQIAQRAFNTPLMLDPGKAAVIARHLGARFLGQGGQTEVVIQGWDERANATHLEPKAASLLGDEVHHGARRRQSYTNVMGVAVIPVTGTLVRRGSFIGESSGMTSYEGLSAQIRAAVADDAVRVIALEIDSFGGEAAGIFDLGQQIRQAREIKPVRAFVADYALSAGYAIASQADSISVPPFGEAGSIGVVCMHVDYEGYLEKEGITVSLIHSGAKKVDGNPFEALPPHVRDELQAEGDDMWKAFAEMVEMGRRGRVTSADALAMEAGIFRGHAAVEVGLADHVAEARAAFAALVEEINPPVRQGGQSFGAVSGHQAHQLEQPQPAGGQQAASAPGGDANSNPIIAELAGRDATNAVPASAAKEEPMDWDSITTAQLREHRADLVEEIETGAKAAASTDTDSRVQEAVSAERARMAAIDEIAVEGYDELVAKAKSDGWSAEKLALEMVKTDKKSGNDYLTGRREADAAAAVEPAPQQSTTEGTGGTPEEQADAKWNKDASLRAEFGNDKDSFLAWTKADAAGRARVRSSRPN